MIELLLFDIDGTLVHTGGAGTRSLNTAFREVFGIDDAFRDVSMAGKTDPLIVRTALRQWEVEESRTNVDACLKRYIEVLRDEMSVSNGRRVMPGIREILERSGALPNVTVGLLTGNIEEGARIKLETMGLWSHFLLGAYGNDSDDRNDLVFVAMDRYRKLTGKAIDPSRVAVVGDTPRDILCSKPYGALAVAVATGPYSSDDLRSHEPHHLFDDLGDTGSFFQALGLEPPCEPDR